MKPFPYKITCITKRNLNLNLKYLTHHYIVLPIFFFFLLSLYFWFYTTIVDLIMFYRANVWIIFSNINDYKNKRKKKSWIMCIYFVELKKMSSLYTYFLLIYFFLFASCRHNIMLIDLRSQSRFHVIPKIILFSSERSPHWSLQYAVVPLGRVFVYQ